MNSLVESEGGLKQIKIRNFQALIDDNYNHNSSALQKTNLKGANEMTSTTTMTSTELGGGSGDSTDHEELLQ